VCQRLHVHGGGQKELFGLPLRKYIVVERCARKQVTIFAVFVPLRGSTGLRKHGPFSQGIVIVDDVCEVRVSFAALVFQRHSVVLSRAQRLPFVVHRGDGTV